MLSCSRCSISLSNPRSPNRSRTDRLHGFDPLAAGFSVATASLAWTAASLAAAGASGPWPDRLTMIGPAIMGLSLTMIAYLAPHSAALLLIPAIALLGAGIGQCWPFVAHRVMDGTKAGEETVAASSVPTVQQMGFAFGAAIAGLVANASGLAAATADEGMVRAASWVPASFVVSAILAVVIALRLRHLRTTSAFVENPGPSRRPKKRWPRGRDIPFGLSRRSRD